MTGRRSRELSVTKTHPDGRRQKVHQYLISVIVLSMAFFTNLSKEAHACSATNGQTGVASYYGPGFGGHRTATGEVYDMESMTAAHPCLPLGTRIRVTVLSTGRSLIVTVNDRMPSHRRILDLSVGAARALGIVAAGVAMVQLSPS
jgi:rare lipoprotein A